MKKILIAFMIVSLALVSLIGCSSSEEANTKTEEELRQEISAELEAEAQARAELEAQIRVELEAEQKKEEPAPQQPTQPAQAAQPTQSKPAAPKLTGFTNETIRGEAVNYSNNIAVIIPDYPANGANSSALSRRPFKTGVADGFEPPVIPVAFLGKAEDVKVAHKTVDLNGSPTVEYMTLEEWDLGTLENTILDVQFWVASYRSIYVITGKVNTGEGAYSDFSFEIGHVEYPEEVYLLVEDAVILFN